MYLGEERLLTDNWKNCIITLLTQKIYRQIFHKYGFKSFVEQFEGSVETIESYSVSS